MLSLSGIGVSGIWVEHQEHCPHYPAKYRLKFPVNSCPNAYADKTVEKL